MSNDKDKPIYVVCGTATYSNTSGARAITPPSLSQMGFNADFKILYRWIFKGDGTFVETTDYRTSAPVASGGTTTVTAGNVTFSPAGNVAATSVQAAIEELDTEKQAVLTFGIADTNKVQINAADVVDNDYAKFTATGLEGRSYAEVLSDIGAAPLGGISWSIVTADANLAINTGTIANKASLCLLALPTTAAVGVVVRVAGMNANFFKVTQAANQYIKFGASTTATGVAGYIQSTATYDAIEMVCIEANVGFMVVSSIGNLTIA